MARTLNSQIMFDYMLHCLKTTYKYFASPSKSTAGKVRSNSQTDTSVNHVDSVKRSTKVPDVRSSPHSAEELEDSDCMIDQEQDEEEEADSDVETEVCSVWMDWLLLLGMQHCHFSEPIRYQKFRVSADTDLIRAQFSLNQCRISITNKS